ncbi:MAG TPA: RluA family pseudouridine synthase [Acidimicrobiia bacterium]|nr:RluA family pseudouridine synthase [Acidimicrobiia bacterium]
MADRLRLVVPEELEGSRADRALSVLLKVSRSVARDLVERGVTVDGTPARPGQRVTAGSVLETPVPDEPEAFEAEPVAFDVLYEDDDVIVVDKPAGVVVHPGAGQTRGTLVAGLLYRFPELSGVGVAGRWGLVHRLDKDTSGVLLVARTSSAFETLGEQMRRREITRVYQALAQGVFDAPTGTIDAPIGRHPTHPMRQAIIPGGRPARTHFEVEREYRDPECSLLTVTLETGRTHQIRVHLAAIGHPVVGDRVYGASSDLDVPRIFLHARRAEFTHPTTGETVIVEAPLPDDLERVLAFLDDESEE